jgi:hypothetical protein
MLYFLPLLPRLWEEWEVWRRLGAWLWEVWRRLGPWLWEVWRRLGPWLMLLRGRAASRLPEATEWAELDAPPPRL